MTDDEKKALETLQKIDIVMPDYDDLINGYQGFEAICFSGSNAYLIMESKFNDKIHSSISIF